MVLVGVYLFPVTFRLLWTKEVIEKEPTSLAQESKRKCEAMAKSKAKNKSKMIPKTIFISLLWAIFSWATYSAIQVQINFKPYDPFEILGVPSNVDDKSLSRVYKNLSRKFHPDKVKAELRESAEKEFLRISRAYKTLTDEKMRKNWEEYGNPDGVRTFALGVALPSWLVSSTNRFFVLLLYCAAFGVGLPLMVRRWWNMSKKYSKGGVLNSTMKFFFKELKENASVSRLLDLLVMADEFGMSADGIEYKASDKKALDSLCSEFTQNYQLSPMVKSSKHATKAFALLFAHLHRIEVVDKSLWLDQQEIISKATLLTDGMIQIALARQWLHPAFNAMNLSQFVVQALWIDDSPMLQLPYIDSDICQHFTKGRRSIKSIPDLLDLPSLERQSLLRSLSEKQMQEVIAIAQTFPIINVSSVSFKTLGQDKITPKGLITCQVRLSLEYPSLASNDEPVVVMDDADKKEALQETEVQNFEFDEDGNLIEEPGKKVTDDNSIRANPIYCPRYSALRRPCWWIALVNRNNTNFICPPSKITDLIDYKTITMQLPAPPKPMPVKLLLTIKSDCFVGADIVKEVGFTVFPSSSNESKQDEWDISGEDSDSNVAFSPDEL